MLLASMLQLVVQHARSVLQELSLPRLVVLLVQTVPVVRTAVLVGMIV